MRLTQTERRRQMIAHGLEIARESGLIHVSAHTVANRVRCHPNLVRRYIGRAPILRQAVISAAVERGVPIVLQ